jgi:hypothetical protein
MDLNRMFDMTDSEEQLVCDLTMHMLNKIKKDVDDVTSLMPEKLQPFVVAAAAATLTVLATQDVQSLVTRVNGRELGFEEALNYTLQLLHRRALSIKERI